MSFKKIKDGLTKTIFVGEKHVLDIDPSDGGNCFGKKTNCRDNSVYNPDNWEPFPHGFRPRAHREFAE